MDYIIIGIALLIVITGVKLKYDLHHTIRHGYEWRLMAGASIPSIVLFVIAAHPYSFWNGALLAVISAGMAAFFLWNLFDGPYNLARGYGWWFTGTEDIGDANTDNFLQSIPLWFQIVIKIGGLAGLIFLYILFGKFW